MHLPGEGHGTLALVAAGVVFLGVPALVARVRRNPKWLLAPVVELAALLVLGVVSAALG